MQPTEERVEETEAQGKWGPLGIDKVQKRPPRTDVLLDQLEEWQEMGKTLLRKSKSGAP